MNEPATQTEAYVAEILDELTPIHSIIKQANDDMAIRIGITQGIIDSHINQANQLLARYTLAAERQSFTIEQELAPAKTELAHLTNHYLKTAVTQSLLDAHHALQQKPVRLNKRIVLNTVLIASLTSGIIGGVMGFAAHYWTSDTLTLQQQQAIEQGKLLLHAWPRLDPQTKANIKKVINAQ